MKQTGILFKPEMIRAINEDRKSMTRRIVKPQPEYRKNFETKGGVFGSWFHGWNLDHPKFDFNDIEKYSPYGTVGDVLYVKEAWKYIDFAGENNGYVYRASENGKDWEENSEGWKWKSPLFMPKAAARIWLEIINIRVEKACDISEEDAIKEGVKPFDNTSIDQRFNNYNNPSSTKLDLSYREGFKNLWFKINGEESWNNWVWVIEFKKIENPNK